jgi:hypothetical protein
VKVMLWDPRTWKDSATGTAARKLPDAAWCAITVHVPGVVSVIVPPEATEHAPPPEYVID